MLLCFMDKMLVALQHVGPSTSCALAPCNLHVGRFFAAIPLIMHPPYVVFSNCMFLGLPIWSKQPSSLLVHHLCAFFLVQQQYV